MIKVKLVEPAVIKPEVYPVSGVIYAPAIVDETAPYINEENHWVVWDAENEAWVDTLVVAKV